MNLSTAGASRRAREVGIRKVLGAVRGELVGQFLLEAVLVTLVAMALALLLVQLALPAFNKLSGKELVLSLGAQPLLLPGLLVGMLAGAYPAFFLSSFQPVAVLKGRMTPGKNSFPLRSGLVVFQFFVSIALMISTVLVYQQLQYIWHKDLGYDRTQVLVLPETWVLGQQEAVFRHKLGQDPRVLRISASGYLPAGPSYGNNNMVFTEDNPGKLVKNLLYEVDHQYIPTLGMHLVAGRNFSPELASDSAGVILNETAARTFGWGKAALGHRLTDFVNNAGDK